MQTASWLWLATQGVDHIVSCTKHTLHDFKMAYRLPYDLYPVALGDAPEQQPIYLYFLTNIV
jgi:hypothetical protein